MVLARFSVIEAPIRKLWTKRMRQCSRGGIRQKFLPWARIAESLGNFSYRVLAVTGPDLGRNPRDLRTRAPLTGLTMGIF